MPTTDPGTICFPYGGIHQSRVDGDHGTDEAFVFGHPDTPSVDVDVADYAELETSVDLTTVDIISFYLRELGVDDGDWKVEVEVEDAFITTVLYSETISSTTDSGFDQRAVNTSTFSGNHIFRVRITAL